eukprot:TRINITY_DN16332_c0_g1_i1.p1 TRINITY_DN16332_c0_g1~~TRINITY_DN16332_c0_g1_i1.p1  ORF type:complete len:374 (-),score=59.54 TRINITY_DN16332_c0_g1_i1:36-1073(-)
MLVRCHLTPGEKREVVKAFGFAEFTDGSAGRCGELHVTNASLVDGSNAALYVHTKPAGRLAVVRLSSTFPSSRLVLTLATEDGAALEVVGGAVIVEGFLDETAASTETIRVGANCEGLTKEEGKQTVKAVRKTYSSESLEAKGVVEQIRETEIAKGAKAPKTKPKNHDVEVVDGKLADFIPSRKFSGAKPGMVFKKGSKGLGYYKDTYEPPPPVSFAGAKRKVSDVTKPAEASAPKRHALPNGLQYDVLKDGPASAPKASRGRRVQVRYEGRLASNGKRFDKGVIRFKLGAGEVIKGWDVGVDGMKVGERRRLFIPAKLGYGSRGAGPDIPPNAALAFEVELLNV